MDFEEWWLRKGQYLDLQGPYIKTLQRRRSPQLRRNRATMWLTTPDATQGDFRERTHRECRWRRYPVGGMACFMSHFEDLKRVAAEARKNAGTDGGTTCLCPIGGWAFVCPVHLDPFARKADPEGLLGLPIDVPSFVHAAGYEEGRRKEQSTMIIRCGWCFTILEEPGALVFTPPDKLGQCTKIHVCVDCFKRVILSATPRPNRP